MSVNRAKLALLIPRLPSDFDGEIVATVRVIRRLPDASGHDLTSILRQAERPTFKLSAKQQAVLDRILRERHV